MSIDKDLQSIQEVRELTQKAKTAQLEFKYYSQEQVDKIIKAMAEAGYAAAERLAKMACEESGFGKYEDKVTKNRFSTKNVYDSIKDLKTVGVIETLHNDKVVKIAEPMGVVAALIPSTNPTSTAMFKSLISLKGRNGIVASPHPRTVNSSREALRIIREAAEKAGAPAGLIQCMTQPTLEGTDALMHDKNIAVILATGSNPMVKAAYSSGKPAYGVGAGNVPAFIERTANYKKAVADIITGTTFDNGTLCSSEQAIIADRPLREKIIDEAIARGGYFVNAGEKKKLASAIANDGRINAEIVGKPAVWIAQYVGFSVPENTSVLIAEIDAVGKQEPLSMEKLSPVLAFYTVDGWLEGCHRCIELLNFGGVGHTMVIHSEDKDIIMKFALEKPAFRILVNTVSALGAVGYTTSLYPSLTLGPGTWGGSIISENVTAKHLINVKHLAFESNPVNKGNSLSLLQGNLPGGHKDFIAEIEDRLKARAGNPDFSKTIAEIIPSRQAIAPQTADYALGKGIAKNDIDRIIKDFKL